MLLRCDTVGFVHVAGSELGAALQTQQLVVGLRLPPPVHGVHGNPIVTTASASDAQGTAVPDVQKESSWSEESGRRGWKFERTHLRVSTARNHLIIYATYSVEK
jgi:hypothetical protein